MAQTTIQGSFLGDATVTGAKVAADFISAQTDLPSGLSTTDEIIVSDAGVIKRMDISVLEIAATQITASGTLPALNGAALTALTAANITASGTLPALSGVNLTALVAGNITAGGTFLAQDGSALTALTAANLTGALPAISGANLTNLPAITTAKILDANVTLAKIESQAANTVLVRDASSSGVVSAKAVADTQLLIGDGTGFTAATLSGDATLANSGGVTVASSHSGSAHHAQSHTVVSHSDTTATGAELETLTDGSTTALHGHSAPAHTVVSHSDTTATGAELETLTDGSTTALHAHSGGGPSQATQSAIEAETNEDTYVPPDLMRHHPGVLKASAEVASNGVLQANSYNITSSSRQGTGDFTLTIATDLAQATGSVVSLCVQNASGAADDIASYDAHAVSTVNYSTWSAGTQADKTCNIAIFGESV